MCACVHVEGVDKGKKGNLEHVYLGIPWEGRSCYNVCVSVCVCMGGCTGLSSSLEYIVLYVAMPAFITLLIFTAPLQPKV